jgi:hypothetical protein
VPKIESVGSRNPQVLVQGRLPVASAMALVATTAGKMSPGLSKASGSLPTRVECSVEGVGGSCEGVGSVPDLPGLEAGQAREEERGGLLRSERGSPLVAFHEALMQRRADPAGSWERIQACMSVSTPPGRNTFPVIPCIG